MRKEDKRRRVEEETKESRGEQKQLRKRAQGEEDEEDAQGKRQKVGGKPGDKLRKKEEEREEAEESKRKRTGTKPGDNIRERSPEQNEGENKDKRQKTESKEATPDYDEDMIEERRQEKRIRVMKVREVYGVASDKVMAEVSRDWGVVMRYGGCGEEDVMIATFDDRKYGGFRRLNGGVKEEDWRKIENK